MFCRHARLVGDCQFSTAMMIQSASRLGIVYINSMEFCQVLEVDSRGGSCVPLGS